ncbi:MAG TPA: hypothetical protein VD837_03175 [Terriglobales bacterium]|nr:hypothetical protein [Terriglobales bacterium]
MPLLCFHQRTNRVRIVQHGGKPLDNFIMLVQLKRVSNKNHVVYRPVWPNTVRALYRVNNGGISGSVELVNAPKVAPAAVPKVFNKWIAFVQLFWAADPACKLSKPVPVQCLATELT